MACCLKKGVTETCIFQGDDSIAATSEEEDSDSNQSSDEYSEGDDNIHSGGRTRRSSSDYGEGESDSVEGSEEEEELSEGDMRLLNMIKINKIDVKLNFPEVSWSLFVNPNPSHHQQIMIIILFLH